MVEYGWETVAMDTTVPNNIHNIAITRYRWRGATILDIHPNNSIKVSNGEEPYTTMVAQAQSFKGFIDRNACLILYSIVITTCAQLLSLRGITFYG